MSERCPTCGQAIKNKQATFYPITQDHVQNELEGLPDDIRSGIIEWGNSSRRSKHGARAVWSRRAFAASSDRVQVMYAADLKNGTGNAVRLVNAGIENGWMGLKPEYLAKSELLAQPYEVKPSRVQLAIDQWNAR